MLYMLIQNFLMEKDRLLLREQRQVKQLRRRVAILVVVVVVNKLNQFHEQQQPLPPTSQQKLQTNVKKEKGEGGGGHVVHVNPKFLNGKGPPPSKRAKTSEATTEKSSDTSGGSSSKQVKPIPRIKQQPQQPRVSKQNVPEPSRSLGAHAFSVVPASQQPQAPPTQQKMQQPPPQQQPIPLSSIIIDQRPPAPVVMIPCTSSASIPPPNLQQPPPQFIKEQPPPQLINIDSIGKTPQQPLTSTFPSPIQNVQHNIQNVTPRLPGVPENNRIFVDGKAYEVFYLDHVAVIERNGLPHRVSFAGPPRDVIIDGIGHCMSFGEQKQVLIDGEIHLLRFGAPSRELYMGNFPFKGAFGGPPIIATINGRRHEIRLCGPPPEVRIDPEPSYELMRYMPANETR